jgi:O-antigen ligase
MFAWIGVLDLARFVAVYLLLVNLIDSWPKWNIVVWLLLLLNFKLSQFQIRSYLQGVGFTDNRESFINQGVGVGVHGFFSNSNDFGVAMCVILPLAVYMVMASKSWLLRVAAALMSGAFMMSILYTSSRGAALGMAVMGLFFWFRSRQKALMGLAVAIILAGYWIVAPPELESRFHSGMDYEQDRSATQRIEAWKGGLRMMAAHPLTGVGMSNFRANIEVDPKASLAARYSHSNWIQAGSELGVFAVVLFLWVLWIAFERNRETRRLLAGRGGRAKQMSMFTYALDISMVGFIVTGTFTAMLYYPFQFVNLALIVSLHAIAKKETAALSEAAVPVEKLESPREAALAT